MMGQISVKITGEYFGAGELTLWDSQDSQNGRTKNGARYSADHGNDRDCRSISAQILGRQLCQSECDTPRGNRKTDCRGYSERGTERRIAKQRRNGQKYHWQEDGSKVVAELSAVLVHRHGERDNAGVEQARENVARPWTREPRGAAEIIHV